jgi:hypothetical protein
VPRTNANSYTGSLSPSRDAPQYSGRICGKYTCVEVYHFSLPCKLPRQLLLGVLRTEGVLLHPLSSVFACGDVKASAV